MAMVCGVSAQRTSPAQPVDSELIDRMYPFSDGVVDSSAYISKAAEISGVNSIDS